MPASLNEALATEPWWLQAWIGILVVVHLAALLFVVRRRQEGGFGLRTEPVAIVVAFLAARSARRDGVGTCPSLR